MTGQLTKCERVRLRKTAEMAVRLVCESGDGVIKKWDIVIRHAFEAASQSAGELTVEQDGRDGFVLSLDWNGPGDMVVHVDHPGEWEAPLRDDAPVLLF